MCDYIPIDPILAVFNEPIKCRHEMVFYSAFLSSRGDVLTERIEKTSYWNEVDNDKEEKDNRTH